MVIYRRGLRPGSANWRPRVAAFDVIWAAASALLAFWLRNPELLLQPDAQQSTLVYAAIALVLTPLIFIWAGIGEDLARYFTGREARGIIAASAFAAAAVAVVNFLIFRLDNAPRSVPVLHFLVLASGILLGRAITRQRQSHRDSKSLSGSEVEHILIVGATRLTSFYLNMIDELAAGSHRPLAIFDERQSMIGRSIGGCPIVGTPSELQRVTSDYDVHGVKVHRIVVTLPIERLSAETRASLDKLSMTGHLVQYLDAELFVAPSSAAPQVTFVETADIVRERRAILRRPYWAMKRGIDIVVSGLLLIALLPMAAILSVVTWAHVGSPILFWQRRVGQGGAPIMVSKFRTLQSPFDARGVRRPEAERLRPLGRFIRATRLDEIPQLFSILTGQMSIVGPRPLLPQDQPDQIGLRLMVAPGLTGWAQVNGGTTISVEEKNALDEWYVRNASLLLDLRILFYTPVMMVLGDKRGVSAIERALLDGERSSSTRMGNVSEITSGKMAGKMASGKLRPDASSRSQRIEAAE